VSDCCLTPIQQFFSYVKVNEFQRVSLIVGVLTTILAVFPLYRGSKNNIRKYKYIKLK